MLARLVTPRASSFYRSGREWSDTCFRIIIHIKISRLEVFIFPEIDKTSLVEKVVYAGDPPTGPIN